MKEEQQPRKISSVLIADRFAVKTRPISATKIAGMLIKNERFKACSLLNLLKRRAEVVIPDRDTPGIA